MPRASRQPSSNTPGCDVGHARGVRVALGGHVEAAGVRAVDHREVARGGADARAVEVDDVQRRAADRGRGEHFLERLRAAVRLLRPVVAHVDVHGAPPRAASRNTSTISHRDAAPVYWMPMPTASAPRASPARMPLPDRLQLRVGRRLRWPPWPSAGAGTPADRPSPPSARGCGRCWPRSGPAPCPRARRRSGRRRRCRSPAPARW